MVQVAARDIEGLWNFACELEQCWYTMDDIGNMSPLNDSYNFALIYYGRRCSCDFFGFGSTGQTGG